MKIVLISDLHVGVGARGLDLCPHELKPEEKIGRASNYLAGFEDWAKAQVQAGEVFDLLCVTGDISNSADPREFELADKAIGRIASALGVPSDKIYFVPGNHDVNWPVMGQEPASFWSQFRFAPMFDPKSTFAARHLKADTGSLVDSPYFTAWNSPDLLVVGVNSAAYDAPTAKPHNGVIKEATVTALGLYLKSVSPSPSQLRICLLHHHLEQYSENLPDSADLSIAVNAENLLMVLTANRFDLLLHGHKHYPRMGTKQPDSAHPLVSICAGSFSAVLHPLYYEGVPNLFHVISVNGREVNNDRVFGVVETWRHKLGKWVNSTETHNLYHREAFGANATPAEISRAMTAAIDDLMRDSNFCEWSALVSKAPLLQYVRTSTAFTTLETVCKDLALEVVGDIQQADRKWVVFRRQ